jgi:adenylate cyclase
VPDATGQQRVERKLAAIVAADIAGYSRLMGADEVGTLQALKAHRKALIDPMIAAHHGRIVKTTGDGILIEFASVVDAVTCSVAIQRGIITRNADVPEDKRILFRVGINLGDVIIDGSDLYGDGVNVAARLEGIADPGGVYISDDVHRQVQGKLDVAFDYIGEHQLKNIAQPVRVYRVRLDAAATKVRPALALPDKPSIAVLPFQNMSGDPGREYFTDGMVEEIITVLSRIRWLFVIARNSSFTYKGHTVDVKQVGGELGVHYVLQGSVRKAGDRMRISGQLIDAISGAHLWADHFDGSLDDVFELQDNVALSVAGVIEPTLLAAEIRRSAQRPTNDLTAYDLYLRARADAESWEKVQVMRALELCGQALNRDPRYGPALALAADCQVSLHANDWTNDLETTRREGINLARHALAVAGDDAYVLANAAFSLGYFGEDIAAALALIDRCLKLNPSFARGWRGSGWLRLWAGQLDLAIKNFETFVRLSPRESAAGALVGIGVGHFFAQRLEEAKAMLLLSLQEHPTWAPILRFLASCCAHMGHLDEARDIVKRLRDITPVVVPSAEHWRNPEHREFYLNGLRLAAGEAI